jgi:hypothetical protein
MEKELLKARLIYGSIFAVVILVGGYLWQQNSVVTPSTENQNIVTPVDVQTVSASLEIEGLNTGEQQITGVVGQTLLGIMRQMNETNPNLNIQTQDYEGLGSLVVQIGAWRNGTDEKYWQYTINDEVPMVGADQYVIQNGDSIKWEFKKSDF